MNECIDSNTVGSNSVFNFCLKTKLNLFTQLPLHRWAIEVMIKIYHPMLLPKQKNLEILENLKKWFNFKYEVIYFYNVYGPKQICKGEMATVIGIFEDHYKRKKPLPVVKPGTQTRRFTHIDDTIDVCYIAWKKIFVGIIVFLIKNLIQLLKLQDFLNQKLSSFLKDLVKDMHLL